LKGCRAIWANETGLKDRHATQSRSKQGASPPCAYKTPVSSLGTLWTKVADKLMALFQELEEEKFSGKIEKRSCSIYGAVLNSLDKSSNYKS
jgi:hypothetical protein